jgi:hypothetical protein
MKLRVDEVKPEDRGVLAPCGIVCLACDLHQDESFEAAKKLVQIWEGFNFLDVSAAFGMDPQKVASTLETLKQYIKFREEAGHCPGCYIGGVGPCAVCPIVKCAGDKGFWTCAECEDYNPETEYPCPHVGTGTSPLESKGAMFSMVCKRYSKNNLENLKRCREIGYPAFIAEVKEKTKKGWRTWQVISKEMLLQGKVTDIF